MKIQKTMLTNGCIIYIGKRTLSIASCVLHRRLCVFFTHSQRCYLGFWRRFNVVYVFYCHGVEKGSLMPAVVCSDWGTCAAGQLGGQQRWRIKSLFQNLEVSPGASSLRNLEGSQEGRAWARKGNRRSVGLYRRRLPDLDYL